MSFHLYLGVDRKVNGWGSPNSMHLAQGKLPQVIREGLRYVPKPMLLALLFLDYLDSSDQKSEISLSYALSHPISSSMLDSKWTLSSSHLRVFLHLLVAI